jgi:CubicO group peptidase (beta-lactamase class C family)
MKMFVLRKTSRVVVAIVLLFGVVAPRAVVRAQSPPTQGADVYADKIHEFEQFVRARMEKDRIPGMTIGFSLGDYTWVEGFGYADIENKTPARAESAYRLASVTKSMTGAAIVQLAERGKIDLDAEIQTYVPDYPKQKWPVTVRQLLTHTAGGQVGSGLGPEHVTTKEVVARISKYPIQYEPGQRFDYQTSGYNLLGAAIENVSGQTFGAYMRENIWLPAGMKDTNMDDVRSLVPNRVRGYDLADGEIKNAPFIDVSSRFGGGGATGTVPDLLAWARAILSGKIISSPKWQHEMLRPYTSKSGRFTGLGDGDEYYALGWLVKPVNGSFAIHQEGSQKGTDTAVFYFPEKHLAIASASNLEFAPTFRYVQRLYEIITGEKWEVRVFTADKADAPIARALDSAYNYGNIYFEEHHQPLTADAKEMAEAFSFFNSTVSRDAARADIQKMAQAVRDARHPVGNQNLIRLGSFISARLRERNGAVGFEKYYAAGAIPFFADYVRLYKSDKTVPKELRFTPAFEKLVERWDADWARTWNDYTRHLALVPETDFETVGARLRKEFAGAEVYPDFTNDIQPIQQGVAALKATKLGVDLYPHSDELLFNWAYFIILSEDSEQFRPLLKQIGGDYERPVVYFKRAFESNPNGVMRAQTFLDIGARWLKRPDRAAVGVEFLSAAVEVHPKNAALREMLGDFLLLKGQKAQAEESYRKAFALDPNVGKGAGVEDYVARKLN